MLDIKLSKEDSAVLVKSIRDDGVDAMNARLREHRRLLEQDERDEKRHKEWQEGIELARIDRAELKELINYQSTVFERIANALDRAFPKPESSENP